MTIMPNENEFDNSIFVFCAKFIARLRIRHMLRQSSAKKNKGVPAHEIFAFLLGLVFANKNFIHKVRRSSSMSRRIVLASASLNEIKAKLDEGLLTVSIPKSEKAPTSRKIDID